MTFFLTFHDFYSNFDFVRHFNEIILLRIQLSTLISITQAILYWNFVWSYNGIQHSKVQQLPVSPRKVQAFLSNFLVSFYFTWCIVWSSLHATDNIIQIIFRIYQVPHSVIILAKLVHKINFCSIRLACPVKIIIILKWFKFTHTKSSLNFILQIILLKDLYHL